MIDVSLTLIYFLAEPFTINSTQRFKTLKVIG